MSQRLSWFFVSSKSVRDFVIEGRPVRPGAYVYHASLARNFESVAETMSLIPSSDPNWGGSLGSASVGRVYLATTQSWAEYYGEILKRNAGEPGEFLAILKVPTRRVTGFVLDSKDEGSLYTTSPVDLSSGSFVWSGEIWRRFSKEIALAIAEGEWDDYVDEETGEVIED